MYGVSFNFKLVGAIERSFFYGVKGVNTVPIRSKNEPAPPDTRVDRTSCKLRSDKNGTT